VHPQLPASEAQADWAVGVTQNVIGRSYYPLQYMDVIVSALPKSSLYWLFSDFFIQLEHNLNASKGRAEFRGLIHGVSTTAVS